MAGPETIFAGSRPGGRGWVLALLIALSLGTAPFGGAAHAQADDPRLGDVVPYYGPEGDEVATVAVEEIVDPFRSYDTNSPPERGNHFVLLRLAVENTGGRALQVDPAAVALQDTLGFLSFPQYVNRGPEATEIDPDLVYGEVATGQTVRGVVLFQVINGAELARVVFQPDRERLVILADLRAGGEDDELEAEAPPATLRPTVEPSAISLPEEPSDEATAEPGASAARYENADFGFSLTYDAETWEASESPDGLTLANGIGTVQITGSEALPTEATACVEEVAADLALTSAREGYALLEGDDGEPATAGDADVAFAIFGFTGRAGDERFEQITCVALPGARGVVLFLQNGPLAALAAEAEAAEALLTGLAFTE